MILINKYELLKEVAKRKYSAASMRLINEQPEVKAIPIEWIKRYIAEEGIYPNRELLSVEQADAIERMVENWEKENETN